MNLCRKSAPIIMIFLAFITPVIVGYSNSTKVEETSTTPPPTQTSTLTPGVEPSPTPTPTPTPSTNPTPTPTSSEVTLESILGVHTTNAVGEQKVIVIMADFPDITPTLSQEQIYNKVFVDLDNYFRDASYGKIWLTGSVIGPYILPHPIVDYSTTIQNLQADIKKHE